MEKDSKKTNWGCIIIGGLGCLWLLVMAGLLIAAIIYFVIDQKSNVDALVTNVDSDVNRGVAITEPLSSSDVAYQVIAYPTVTFTNSEYPGVQATIEHIDMPPPTNPEDSVFVWVGATLLNDYFVQVGMSSSSTVDDAGNMQWNYFWEMWDDEDNYLYGYQAPLSDYGWDNNSENTFTITCQDPATGEWEFWVNETVVGTTTTGNCDFDVADTSLVLEITTPTLPASDLPELTPVDLTAMEYWDGYDWIDVDSATLTYGYGLIKDGTEIDQASVCPPYGVTGLSNGFRVGSDLECLADGAVLWDL